MEELLFHDLSGGSAELTWAQREIWESVSSGLTRPEGDRPGQRHLLQFPVAGAPSIDRVIGSIRRLVIHHEALRTTFTTGADGIPRQAVLEAGRIPVLSHQTAAAAPDVNLRLSSDHALRNTLQDLFPAADAGFDPHVGAVVVLQAGKVAAVALSLSRMAVDGWGIGLLGHVLRRCADEEQAVEPAQLRDQARFEASPQGAALTQRALTYWTESLSGASRLGWADRMGLRSADRYCQGVMRSHAVLPAALALGKRHSTSPSVVLLATVNAVLGHLIGRDAYYFRLQAANRWSPAQRAAVGRYKQVALLPVSLRPASFGDLLRATSQRSLLAYRHSRYDPVRLEGPVAVLKDGPFFNYNDRRQAADESPPDPHRATELLVETSPNHAPNPRFDLTLDSAHGALRLGAKSNFLSADQVTTLLEGIEELLTEAARTDADVPWQRVLG